MYANVCTIGFQVYICVCMCPHDILTMQVSPSKAIAAPPREIFRSSAGEGTPAGDRPGTRPGRGPGPGPGPGKGGGRGKGHNWRCGREQIRNSLTVIYKADWIGFFFLSSCLYIYAVLSFVQMISSFLNDMYV